MEERGEEDDEEGEEGMRGDAKALPPLAVLCHEAAEGSEGTGKEEDRNGSVDQVEVIKLSSLSSPNDMRPIEKKDPRERDDAVTAFKADAHTSAVNAPLMVFMATVRSRQNNTWYGGIERLYGNTISLVSRLFFEKM